MEKKFARISGGYWGSLKLMPNKLVYSWQLPLKPWRFLLIIVLFIGIFFRFANLD
ncbi:MAG: hypothetical protein QNJ55_06555 [Xenococcus sp. MO_188.B8]|nr:hypothetical protein [Xenococcus sp. MO_188.B8]